MTAGTKAMFIPMEPKAVVRMGCVTIKRRKSRVALCTFSPEIRENFLDIFSRKEEDEVVHEINIVGQRHLYSKYIYH